MPSFTCTIEVSIPIYESGAFGFYATYAELPELTSETRSESALPSNLRRTPTYYIDVAPRLSLDGRHLPLPALSVFSVISKFMGKYPQDWESHLRGISGRGYNMVHFTPLQVRGQSNSPYSLCDQLGWDPECFPRGEKDIQELVNSLESNHSLLSLTDIVLNHTANSTKWLEEHPDAGYNLTTAPWLESACLLDTKLLELGYRLEELGLPAVLKSEDDLLKIMDAIRSEVLANIKLWEYFVLDVDRDADAALEAWVSGSAVFPPGSLGPEGVSGLTGMKLVNQAEYLTEFGLLGSDRLGGRFRRRANPEVAAAILSATHGKYGRDSNHESDKEVVREKLVELLDAVNLPLYKDYDTEVKEILRQLYNRIKYVRLDDHGPKLGPINRQNPLIESYFTRLPLNSTTAKHRKEDLVLVNNGWVWGGNALIDNAGPRSRSYLRREIIVWGDCVKLRYGNGPEDSAFLWEHMTKYARMLAKYFAGFRIDNAHSTPLHVAEHILDEARLVRPNLYVTAELFTGSEETDYLFIKRLCLSSLIREAMQAWSPGEMSRLVHRHGGWPIGSLGMDDEVSKMNDGVLDSETEECKGTWKRPRTIIRRIKRLPAHALFMDCTHDNEVPAQKRDARDTLANAALVSMCASATGSVMGYDEVYPKIVDLVKETRLYASESTIKPVIVRPGEHGIGGIKKLLNKMHTRMGEDGYNEIYVHHEDEYITVHRVHPDSRKGYFVIARTAFTGSGNGSSNGSDSGSGNGNGSGTLSPVNLGGTKARQLGSWTLEVDASEKTKQEVMSDKKFLRGLPSRIVDLTSVTTEVKDEDTIITIRKEGFPPGSISLFETWMPSADHEMSLDSFVTSGAKAAFGDLDLVELNFLLYKSEPEERDASDGRDGTYDIPDHGKLIYAGLQGWWSLVEDVIWDNKLAHPLCQNLRDGQWAMDYIVSRLIRASKKLEYSRLSKPASWFQRRFDAARKIPNFLLPRYFCLIIRASYIACWERGMELLSDNIRNGPRFLQSLAMVSVQETGLVQSASLYPNKLVPSLAAGLPHFAVDWARCWGRDVFIALRGLYLGTGRFEEAKEHILAFASVLKHGMIPNLLGSGKNPRYNSRDSIWFFLQCIQDYTKIVPRGMDILRAKVKRRFLPYDDTWFPVDDSRAYSKENSVAEVIQEALQRHAKGLSFREANAGPGLDSQMRDSGFNIEVKVDWETGFVHGGSQTNCGTWMDKMGESIRAGSQGVPGTPRDGAAVEITGLLYSTLRWLAELYSRGEYSHSCVVSDDGSEITFAEWADKIQAHFERCYYIPLSPEEDAKYAVNPQSIARRGVYKDLFKSGREHEDYQLRPNFCITMTVAPDIFNPTHALRALITVDSVLCGPTGMATLDPQDKDYRPYYHNSEDSDDFATSKGRNYHQGPEWLWPRGFFLRALLKFDLLTRRQRGRDDVAGRNEALLRVAGRLKGCRDMIDGSPWAGLTELTQRNGEFCGDSVSTPWV